MKKLSNIVSWLGNFIDGILDAHLPVSVWLDSTALALYKIHR
jgi:hypothetical protein